MKPHSRIALAGPPFSGKTAVGRRLARMLELEPVDLDREIEAGAGRSIPEIFRDRGEEGFRKLEAAALDRALRRDGVVIALGGGALLDPDCRRRVLRLCTVFTLWASEEETVSRWEQGGRPLAPTPQALRLLLRKRRRHYLSLPRRVDTTGRTPEEVCAEIAGMVGAG
ncbi:MAG: shikimate kinase [Candidatus Fermentibacteraceae bacterium]